MNQLQEGHVVASVLDVVGFGVLVVLCSRSAREICSIVVSVLPLDADEPSSAWNEIRKQMVTNQLLHAWRYKK